MDDRDGNLLEARSPARVLALTVTKRRKGYRRPFGCATILDMRSQRRKDEMDAHTPPANNQSVQRELVDRARALPGVADVLDVYGKLSQYTNVLVNVQPSQVRNATGGNPT